LEPQPWRSYKKPSTKDATEITRQHFDTVKLRPTDFPALLLEVGFESVEPLLYTKSDQVAKGFQRKVYLCEKCSSSSNSGSSRNEGKDNQSGNSSSE
jgi:Bicoid-interacting protein 3 (Bin3)